MALRLKMSTGNDGRLMSDFAELITRSRKAMGYTRYRLGLVTALGSGLIARVERDTYQPTAEQVHLLATGLRIDVDHALVTAGYAPAHPWVADLILQVKAERALDPDLWMQIQRMFDLTALEQREFSDKLRTWMDVILSERGAPKLYG